MLSKFKTAEIIFGFEDVISYNLQEIIALQSKTIERIIETSSRSKVDLLSKIDDNVLKLFVARKKLSHEKIYILKAADGRTRVITGSANMSISAFSGKQRENIICFDNQNAFEWYMTCFNDLKDQSSDSISKSAIILKADGENLQEIPVMQSVKIKKALVIEPNNDISDEIKFVMDVKNLANQISSFVPKVDKKGKIILSPDMVIQTKRRIIDGKLQEKELRSEYPQLLIDISNGTAMLNSVELNLNPKKDEVKNDVQLFLEYMEGYKRFHGDSLTMQYKYYSFANWFFTSPFMAQIRILATRYNQTLLPYPIFGLVYGQSKAGKTTFLETLLKMMIGQKTKLSAPEFTRSNIDGLRKTVQGAPIIVDDLTQARFNQHAIETIKNDDFGVADNISSYPVVVISANEDIKAVAAEITRRTVICHVKAGLKNTELMKTSIVRKVHKNIGTAFYREYLRRMLSAVPDLLNEIKSDDIETAPDILKISSEIIYQIIKEHSDIELPQYVRLLTLDDYFNEKITGSQAINEMKNAWKVNKKAFDVNKKLSQLTYNTGQVWEANRILKELPEDLEPYKTREHIVMDLDKASEFFEIDFRKQSSLIYNLLNK